MQLFRRKPMENLSAEDALPGRPTEITVRGAHLVLGTSMTPPWPAGFQRATFAMGCFWGAEKFLWQVPGVHSSFVGYAGGFTPNPTYEEVCSQRTGHAEAAVVIYDPAVASYDDFLKVFWENHDPTQWMGQGGDIGTQYRSAIYTEDDAQKHLAEESRERYQLALTQGGFGEIVTQIEPAGMFYYAEQYHQQYLKANPHGYCNHGFCQASYPMQAGTGAPLA